MKFFLSLMVLMVSVSAFADQCAWNDKKHAKDSLEFIKVGETLASFCQPCGDRVPTSLKVKTVSIEKRGRYSEVMVNGRGVDLAYLYTRSGNHFYNIAGLVGCPASGVSFSFRAR